MNLTYLYWTLGEIQGKQQWSIAFENFFLIIRHPLSLCCLLSFLFPADGIYNEP